MGAGAYGIEEDAQGGMQCGTCGKRWAEDITPAGRCPWEHEHDDEHDDLDRYEVVADDDGRLWVELDGDRVCEVEDGDTFGTLMRTVLIHKAAKA